jgi:Ca2+-binding RTX toxin-like protein
MRRLVIAAVCAATTTALLVGAPAASAASCAVTGTTVTYTLTSGESAQLRVNGNRVSIAGANCPGGPNATATDAVGAISVVGAAGNETLTIADLAAFKPGVGAEPGGTAEIEIGVDLGAGTDTLALVGSAANDVYVAGTSGLDGDNDDDADVTLGNLEKLSFDGSGGNDTLSAGGDASTGTASSLQLTITGGLGNDLLTGGTRNDTFLQEAGSDTMSGGGGLDTASYAAATATVKVTVGSGANDGTVGEADNVKFDVEIVRGGAGADVLTGIGGRQQLFGNAGNDRLSGGNANDLLRGGAGNDIMTGGAGADSMYGDAGADTFNAFDRVKDTLSGGLGIDRSHHDAIDRRIGIERAF